MSWSTVSKAEEMSNKTRTVHFPESADVIITQDTFRSAVSVFASCLDKTFSRTRTRTGVFTLPYSSSSYIGLSLFFFLSRGSTTECLKEVGNRPEESDILNSLTTQHSQKKSWGKNIQRAWRRLHFCWKYQNVFQCYWIRPLIGRRTDVGQTVFKDCGI